MSTYVVEVGTRPGALPNSAVSDEPGIVPPVPFFGGAKRRSVAAYDQAQSLAVQVLNAVAYYQGYSIARGPRPDRNILDLVRWVPQTSNALMWAMLKKPSTATSRIDAGEIVPTPRAAAAVLMTDLFAFLRWTGVHLDESFLNSLGSYDKSPDKSSMLSVLNATATAVEDDVTQSLAQRVSSTSDWIAKASGSSGDTASQVGGFGGIIVSRCEHELLGGDPTHLDAFDSPEPLRQWFVSVATALAIHKKIKN